MNFTALDVETANADVSSICQVGLAVYQSGQLVTELKTLVDPDDYFDDINVSIHGIDSQAIQGAPRFPEVYERLSSAISGQVVVCHTHFDRTSITKAVAKHGLIPFSCTWMDSACVARRTWEECAWSGYGLKDLCDRLGYEFRHHDALEDAKAAAHIFLKAMVASGLDLEGWLKRVNQPIIMTGMGGSSGGGRVARDGNVNGPLHGEILVFTGTLAMSRQEAAAMAAEAGCTVCDTVSKKTTLLVVGDQDTRKLAGQERSTKHRKAETLIRQGNSIRILLESDFRDLVQATKRALT